MTIKLQNLATLGTFPCLFNVFGGNSVQTGTTYSKQGSPVNWGFGIRGSFAVRNPCNERSPCIKWTILQISRWRSYLDSAWRRWRSCRHREAVFREGSSGARYPKRGQRIRPGLGWVSWSPRWHLLSSSCSWPPAGQAWKCWPSGRVAFRVDFSVSNLFTRKWMISSNNYFYGPL